MRAGNCAMVNSKPSYSHAFPAGARNKRNVRNGNEQYQARPLSSDGWGNRPRSKTPFFPSTHFIQPNMRPMTFACNMAKPDSRYRQDALL